ncbi:TonB C-terminal domain-containing protein [Marinicella litoralis]|uniref:Colicin import membrane protein n=1 Tax=Marinicella litoralis TaxID=644220 RepID=A0A4R6Y3R6_9GAMM|nr:TonB C-terminal domain-containing protein [Marinicella litoralis]TDR23728.1 colicin import membrane protein [Marinicella litoralis]
MAVLSIEPEQRQGLLYSLGLHVAIVVLLMVSTQQTSITPPKGIAIQAEIMDLDEYMKSLQKPTDNKPKPVKKPPPKEQAKPEPPKPEPVKPDPVKPEPKVEPKPIEKPVIKPKVDEVKREEKTERQKKLEEIRRQRQAAEAQANKPPENTKEPEVTTQEPDVKPVAGVQNGAENARRTLLTQYIGAIQSAVTRQWARPNGTPAGLQCQIKVNQIPGGGVIDVSIGTPCNASAVVRNSIINAVKKADPLPYTGFESVFDRRLNFIFQYQGD